MLLSYLMPKFAKLKMKIFKIVRLCDILSLIVVGVLIALYYIS